jgi:Spy/CpxP family protein refolding chaperone
MRKKVTAILLGGAFALSIPAAAALADTTGDPHAGGSGHFKGGSKPCKVGGAAPKCPPQND